MDARRSADRRKTLKQGQAVLSNSTLIDCVIRDMSDSGARLEFGGPTEIPPKFKLLFTSSKQAVPVEVTWRRGFSVGVRFTGST